MSFQNVLSVIAGVLFVAGFVPYIRAILAGSTKPAKASWIIWASLDTITIFGMAVQHTLNGQIIGAVTGAWIVVALALKYGTKGWTWLDKFCLVGAVLGIVLWKVFSSPTLGIITSNSVVFLGSIPTFVSAWKDPTKEDKLGWTIFWLSCICAVVAIPRLTFDDAVQPIVFCSIETIMMYLLYVKPFLKRRCSVAGKYPPISPGTAVRTTQPNLEKREEWTDEGWAKKKWGVNGKVLTHHDSHGLCYDVLHDDGSRGCYDPSEIAVEAES